jgi:ATP-dependent exoDNAse (exonuclease V) alpha subunit
VNLTQGQVEAIRAVEAVQVSHPQGGGVVVISGYAGTGKTTCLGVLGEEERLTVLAPTGKAAMRVREATGMDASTIHRWLYTTVEDPNTGRLSFEVKDSLAVPRSKLVFVDEASMVGIKIFSDLWRAAKKFDFNLVFLGDGFQLPPVAEDDGPIFNLLAPDAPFHYRVQMNEVVRQALDSPIIRASMRCRDLRDNLSFLGTDIPVVDAKDLVAKGVETWRQGGAVICHRNVTRHSLNNDIRRSLGHGDQVVAGEPLMVLFNNYEIDAYNGEILTVDSSPRMLGSRPYPVRDRHANETMNMTFYRTTVHTVTGEHQVAFADKEVFGQSAPIGMKAIRLAGKDLTRNLKVKEQEEISGGWVDTSTRQQIAPDPVINANLGYALTAHKAQGSEFPTALVALEGSVRLHSEEGRRWVYTSLTRAKRTATVCWL